MKVTDFLHKPGTPEHNEWVKSRFIQYQRDPANPDLHKAIQTADSRLARLRAQYDKAVLLDPDIDALVNGNGVVDLNCYSRIQDVINSVNETWDRTKLGPVDTFAKYVPQIDSAPDFANEELMYKILQMASMKDIDDVKRCWNGLHQYAMQDPNWLRNAMNVPLNQIPHVLNSSRVGIVNVKYLTYRR